MTTDPHAIVAEYRLTTQYTISAFPHKNRLYVYDAGLVAGQWQLASRGGTGLDLAWQNSATRAAQIIASAAISGAVIGESLLEHRVGEVWDVIDTYTPTVTPSGTATFTTAGLQMTITLRDEKLNRFKWEGLELIEVENLTSKAKTGHQAGTDAIIAALVTVAGSNPNDPVNWMCSKYRNRVKDGGFVSLATYPNRKILRARKLK